MKNIQRRNDRGATALFIVIFSILLMSTITISFLSLMVSEQQRSTNDELSQSAYDSALAGVEDAKRAIVASRGSGAIATQFRNAINDSQDADGCQAIGMMVNGITSPVSEIPVQSTTTSSGGAGAGDELNQAYTCLKVDNLTDNFLVSAEEDTVVFVPLRMASQIDQIRVSWQRAEEIPGVGYATSGTLPLLTHSDWNSQRTPAMIRLQTVTPSGSFSLNDFDDSETSSTIFLYPSDIGAGGSTGVDLDMPERAGSLTSPNTPEGVACASGSVLPTSFLCSVTINLARPVAAASDVSFLVIRPIYRGATVQIEGLYGGNLVQFDGAQPAVDSTGRANDLFRRVEARLTLGGEGESGSGVLGPIPQYALDVDGSICKNFYVSVNTSGVFGTETCEPAP